jgi:hypothetical protein
LDSKNGVYVNGIKISEGNLYIGDEVKIGETVITIIEEMCSPEIIKHLVFTGTKNSRLATGIQLETSSSEERAQKISKIKLDDKSVSSAREKLMKDPLYKDSVKPEKNNSENEIEVSPTKKMIASLIDKILFGAIIVVPTLYLQDYIPFSALAGMLNVEPALITDNKYYIVVLISLIISMIFNRWNKARVNGTIGESIMGIGDKD